MTDAFMAVRYDGRGSFTDVSFHDTEREALDAASEAGCRFVSIGEHPKAKTTRHFAREGDGWRELRDAEELDRLMSTEEPRMFWRAA